MRFLTLVILVIFLISGCATTSKTTRDKKIKKKPTIHRVDFDNDGIKEIVRIEEGIIRDKDTDITILTKRKKVLDKLTVTDFDRLDFIDLDNNDYKQIAVYTKDDLNYSNLVIYSLKNGSLNEIFAIGSPVALDTNFRSCIPRIKAGIPKQEGQLDGPNYEVWVWSGYKFIKDHNE